MNEKNNTETINLKTQCATNALSMYYYIVGGLPDVEVSQDITDSEFWEVLETL